MAEQSEEHRMKHQMQQQVMTGMMVMTSGRNMPPLLAIHVMPMNHNLGGGNEKNPDENVGEGKEDELICSASMFLVLMNND